MRANANRYGLTQHVRGALAAKFGHQWTLDHVFNAGLHGALRTPLLGARSIEQLADALRKANYDVVKWVTPRSGTKPPLPGASEQRCALCGDHLAPWETPPLHMFCRIGTALLTPTERDRALRGADTA